MKLPTFEDLSYEQDEVYNLPLDGSHVVTGAPGTGKSVMALYRAQALEIDERRPTVIMFSNVLKQYTEDAASELKLEGQISTFHGWLNNFWREHYRRSTPTLPSGRFDINWPEVIAQFASDPPSPGSLNDLLVDEGQDLSPEFFGLARWICRNITVFADENQQLTDEQCTIENIRRAINTRSVHTLSRNYRNTHEIARLANHFYVGAPSGVPELPTRHGDKPTLTNYSELDGVVDRIAKYARAHTDHTIGVACQFTGQQKRLLDKLKAKRLSVPVSTYISRDKSSKTMDFDSPGVKIINYMSIKGLEFDALFVPELESVTKDASSAGVRMTFYVVSSRARRELHLSWCGDGPEPDIVAKIETDILERK